MNFQMARSNMVAQQVRPWQVFDNKVLSCMLQIPRERFVPLAYHSVAYSDTDIPLTEGQSLLSPKIVGRILQALQLSGSETVLEIGSGTGYLSACLSKLANMVFSIEIQSALLSQAQINLEALGCRNVKLILGNAADGWKEHAPYDAIVVTGAYPQALPEKICEQLKPKGRLFAFVGMAPAMKAVLITRQGKNDYLSDYLFETVVPTLSQVPQPKSFQF